MYLKYKYFKYCPPLPPIHGLSLQQMPSPWRHSVWNANAESWESHGCSLFATRNVRAHWSTCHQRRHPTSSHRRLWSHRMIARLQDNTPAHKAIQSHVNLSLGRPLHPSWSCRPGRPHGGWIDRIRNDTSQTPADLWRQALGRAWTRRPTLAMRWWFLETWRFLWWGIDMMYHKVFSIVNTQY